ncbi:unnamed protein product [Musa textilis]
MSHQRRDDEHGEPSREVAPAVPKEWSGEEGTYHIMARGMDIIWSNDERFWKWQTLPPEDELRQQLSIDAENRSCEIAELNQVSWLEATKTLDLDEEKYKRVFDGCKTCEILYNIKFKVDAFGWHGVPVTFQVNSPKPGDDYTRDERLESYRKRSSGWHQIDGGRFTVPEGEKKGKVKFGMYEIKSQRWKGGILLAGVTLKLHKG